MLTTHLLEHIYRGYVDRDVQCMSSVKHDKKPTSALNFNSYVMKSLLLLQRMQQCRSFDLSNNHH